MISRLYLPRISRRLPRMVPLPRPTCSHPMKQRRQKWNTGRLCSNEPWQSSDRATHLRGVAPWTWESPFTPEIEPYLGFGHHGFVHYVDSGAILVGEQVRDCMHPLHLAVEAPPEE